MTTELSIETKSFLSLDSVFRSLIDFIRPESFIAPDEMELFQQVKEKKKKNVDLQSMRTTSSIYRFLGESQSGKSKNKEKKSNVVTREDLLKKLHDKLTVRERKPKEKRKRSKETTKERPKKIRMAPAVELPLKEKENLPAKISYGRFEFNAVEAASEKSKSKKLKKGQSKEKKLGKTLKKLENEQEEIKRLREENPERGREIVESKRWKTALAKAKGEKILDDPNLIRKSIKKKQKIREKSSKKWKQLKKQTEQRVKQRQDKRQANIQKRKDDKKAKMKKKLIKKGRLIG